MKQIIRMLACLFVALTLAAPAMAAMPIEDKVAMSLVLIAKQGISGIQAGDKVTPVNDKQ